MKNVVVKLSMGSLAVFAAAQGAEVTYSKDVAPILFNRCSACHHSGDIAPMSLMTYAEVRPWARAIRESVTLRRMPPWHADPHYGRFANDRRLPDSEIETIRAWVAGGTKEGNPHDLPPAPVFADQWKIGKPDMVVSIPQDFIVKPESGDEYVYFRVPTNLKEDVWVQSVELRPGNRKVVHHAHVYLKLPPVPAAKAEPKPALSSADLTYTEGKVRFIRPNAPVVDDGCSDPNGGYWPGRKPGDSGAMLGSYLPGKEPDVFPAGFARKIPAGAMLEFQVHYNSKNVRDAESDRTTVAFAFAKEPPKQRLGRIDISNFLFSIPPNDPNHQVTACYTFQDNVRLMSYTAHMHLRGKDMKFEALYPDGRSEVLMSVPRYDFNWQTEYKLARPVAIPAGTRLKITAHFDNSANNPANPNPTKMVRWGEPSEAEMMDGWVEYVLPESRDLASKSGADSQTRP